MSHLNSTLTRRVLAGENKSDIHRDYAATALSKRVEKTLALIATPENRAKAKSLNAALLVCYTLLTLAKFFAMTFFHPAQPLANAIVAYAITGLIYLGVVGLLATHNFIGYVLIFAFGFRGAAELLGSIPRMVQAGAPVHYIVFDSACMLCVLACFLLSYKIFRMLFPTAGNFFLFPDHDAEGRPIFKD